MESLNEAIAQWTGHKRWKLQYRATLHGFAPNDFHSRCNDKGESLVIYKDESGYIYGGYTKIGWQNFDEDSDLLGIYDPEAFVFSLLNPKRIPPVQFKQRKYSSEEVECYSVYYDYERGPSFCVDRENLLLGWSCKKNELFIDTDHLFQYFQDPTEYSPINYETFDFTDRDWQTFTCNRCKLTEIEVFVLESNEM